MHLADIFTRKAPLKRAFVVLENGMNDVLEDEFMLPPEPARQGAADHTDDDVLDFLDNDDQDIGEQPREFVPADRDRVTSHTQNRLAGYAAFDEARGRSQEELNRIAASLSAIIAAQHVTRDFLNDCYADIHRANDLEVANQRLSGDVRRMGDRIEKLEKLRTRYDQLVAVLKHRETKLRAEAEGLRDEVGELKLEAIDTRNVISRAEAQQGELHAELAARNSEIERLVQENALMRERNTALSVEVDQMMKKQGELRRKHDELTTKHMSESAALSELTAKLAGADAEVARLTKVTDAQEARLVEANDAATTLSDDLNAREKRHQSETLALKSEIHSLTSRLATASAELRHTSGEMAAMRSRFDTLESEKQLVEQKYAALAAEADRERHNATLKASAAVSGQGSGRDLEVAGLRREIDGLNDQITKLKHYERVWIAARDRAKANGLARRPDEPQDPASIVAAE